MSRIIAGRHAVHEALRGRARAIEVIYAAESERGPLQTLMAAAKGAGVKLEVHDRTELDALAGDVRHQGILAIVGQYPYVGLEAVSEATPDKLLVALDQIQDPHNFGAIVRSAVALGADGVITLKDRACPVTRTVVRASAGATERATIARVTNLGRALTTLSTLGFQIVGLTSEGDTPIDALPEAERGRVVVVGSEGSGLRRLVRKQCDVLARIDLPGPIASLNASVAAGIAIHACRRPRG